MTTLAEGLTLPTGVQEADDDRRRRNKMGRIGEKIRPLSWRMGEGLFVHNQHKEAETEEEGKRREELSPKILSNLTSNLTERTLSKNVEF